MKIEVRFFPNDRGKICDDPEIANFLAIKYASPWLVWGKEKADRYVQAFAKGAGCEMRLNFNLTWGNAKKYDYFLLTSKHVACENDKVYRANLEYNETLPTHHKTIFGSFKIRNKVFVDKIKALEDRIWSMEFCEAFIAREELVLEMLATFSGIEKAEVMHYRSQNPIDDWLSFNSKYWLPQLKEDETTYVKNLDHGTKYIEIFGLYSAKADDLKGMPDIFRMPQVYNTFGDSQYVVNKRVMEYWFSKGIKKSFFLQPLLISGSEQYEAYLDLWKEIKLALSVNPKNKIV